jgi:Anticodon binding domain
MLSTLEGLCIDPSLWGVTPRDSCTVNRVLVDLASEKGWDMQSVYFAHRLAMTGLPHLSSPSVDSLSQVLGQEESLFRVRATWDLLWQIEKGVEEGVEGVCSR